MSKILMIEDDQDAAEAMRLMLEAEGYEVINAFNFDDGLAKLKSVKPDAVMLDVMLGGRSGFDLAQEVRKDKTISATPILMVSAVNTVYEGFNFSPKSDNEYLPVDEFINKPAQPDELYQKLDKLVKMKESKWKNWPEARI